MGHDQWPISFPKYGRRSPKNSWYVSSRDGVPPLSCSTFRRVFSRLWFSYPDTLATSSYAEIHCEIFSSRVGISRTRVRYSLVIASDRIVKSNCFCNIVYRGCNWSSPIIYSLRRRRFGFRIEFYNFFSSRSNFIYYANVLLFKKKEKRNWNESERYVSNFQRNYTSEYFVKKELEGLRKILLLWRNLINY